MSVSDLERQYDSEFTPDNYDESQHKDMSLPPAHEDQKIRFVAPRKDDVDRLFGSDVKDHPHLVANPDTINSVDELKKNIYTDDYYNANKDFKVRNNKYFDIVDKFGSYDNFVKKKSNYSRPVKPTVSTIDKPLKKTTYDELQGFVYGGNFSDDNLREYVKDPLNTPLISKTLNSVKENVKTEDGRVSGARKHSGYKKTFAHRFTMSYFDRENIHDGVVGGHEDTFISKFKPRGQTLENPKDGKDKFYSEVFDPRNSNPAHIYAYSTAHNKEIDNRYERPLSIAVIKEKKPTVVTGNISIPPKAKLAYLNYARSNGILAGEVANRTSISRRTFEKWLRGGKTVNSDESTMMDDINTRSGVPKDLKKEMGNITNDFTESPDWTKVWSNDSERDQIIRDHLDGFSANLNPNYASLGLKNKTPTTVPTTTTTTTTVPKVTGKRASRASQTIVGALTNQSQSTVKKPRCPNGEFRSRKTGNCEKKKQ